MFNKTPDDASEPVSQQAPPAARPSGARVASLGPSISISGTLSGKEDLIIEGSVEGEVTVRDHKVTVSDSGRVQADIFGRSIFVEGQVDGNLFGDEQVVIRQSGRVRGNVTAPRVNLENGAKFKGSIDMQPGSKAGASEPAPKKKEKKIPNVSGSERRGRSAGVSPGIPAVR